MSEVKTFVCKGCGGALVFDPASQGLKCAACGQVESVQHQAGDMIREYPIEDAYNASSVDWQSPTSTVKCGGCGAETIVPSGSGTVECAFCGSQQVVTTAGNSNAIRPESLIPFQVDRDSATEKFKTWLKKRWLAPKVVREAGVKAERFHSVYLPYWTFDAQTYSSYTAQIGTYYYTTETRTVTDADGKSRQEQHQVRHTRWHTQSGEYDHFFDDVTVLATKHDQGNIMEKLTDYHMSSLLPYRVEYLAGCEVLKYTVNAIEGFETAKRKMHDTLMLDIRKTLHGDEVRNINLSTRHENVKFKHILLPMWISAFRFKEKVYNFIINGQSGTIKGNYPLDPWKITGLVLIGLAVILGIVLLLTIGQPPVN